MNVHPLRFGLRGIPAAIIWRLSGRQGIARPLRHHLVADVEIRLYNS
jgi:hypothetical protein